MPKKFFDIIPPKEIERDKEREKEIKPVFKKKRYFFKNLVFCLSILILLGFIGSLFFSKIKIEIWLETYTLELGRNITVDLGAENSDFDNNVIKGEVLTNYNSASQEFPATGKSIKEEKARGVITVYNSYSTSSRTLIPSRFVSSDGKLFWSLKKVTIPGSRYEKGKLVPGEIEIEVEAVESGEEYNIGPSTFALPALAGTALYTTIYARSFSSMSGGFEGEAAQMTQGDLNKAEAVLIEKLKKESRDLLKTKISENLILLNEAISYNVIEVKSSHEVGAGTESFNLEAEIESKAILFRRSDIDALVKDYINLNIKQDQKLQEESLEINYSLIEIDLESGRLSLYLRAKARAYKDIDLDKIKKALLGKSINEARIFLNDLPEITNIELKSWSFLKRRIPEDMNKLEIKLNLD